MLLSSLQYLFIRTLVTYCLKPLSSVSLTQRSPGFASCVHSGNFLKVNNLDSCWACFSSLRNHFLCMMCCVLQTVVSCILSILKGCFRQESKFSPCYFVLAKSRFGDLCTSHLFSCPQFLYFNFF